jgi:pilus assembly protein HofO
MDKPLPDWIKPWLSRPGWQLLGVQWLLLAGLILLSGTLLVYGEWQQREHLRAQLQRLEEQVAERQQQLAYLPALEELERRLQDQTLALPTESESFGSRLYQIGGVLLRWQQQEQPAQQIAKLQVDYPGLLRLLEGLSPTLRIVQIAIEKQPEGLITQLILLAAEGRSE